MFSVFIFCPDVIDVVCIGVFVISFSEVISTFESMHVFEHGMKESFSLYLLPIYMSWGFLLSPFLRVKWVLI